VSFAVNSCLNHSFLHLYLLFYYISVAVTWYGVRDTHYFLDAPVAQPAPTKFGTKVAIVTYSPNRSCVPNLKLLASTVAEINSGSQIYLGIPEPGPLPIFIIKVVSRQATPQAQVVYQFRFGEYVTITTLVPNLVGAGCAPGAPQNCGYHVLRTTYQVPRNSYRNVIKLQI